MFRPKALPASTGSGKDDPHFVRVRSGKDAEHDSHQSASQRKRPFLAETLDFHEPCAESDTWETNAGLDLYIRAGR